VGVSRISKRNNEKHSIRHHRHMKAFVAFTFSSSLSSHRLPVEFLINSIRGFLNTKERKREGKKERVAKRERESGWEKLAHPTRN